MTDLALRFCARGHIAERTRLELHSEGGATRAYGSARTRVASGRMVFRARVRSGSSISLDRERLGPRFLQVGDELLVEALQAIRSGLAGVARNRLGEVRKPPDAAFLGGALALEAGRAREAEQAFDRALAGSRRLGRALRRFGIDARLWFALTPELALCVRPERKSILFLQAQLLRELGRDEDARSALTELRRLVPQDLVIRLCLADLLLAGKARRDDAARRTLRLSDGVTGASTLGISLLLFRAKALRRLGRSGAARDLCARVIARTRRMPRALLLAFHFEHARAASDLRDYVSERRSLDQLSRLAPGYEAKTPLDLGELS